MDDDDGANRGRRMSQKLFLDYLEALGLEQLSALYQHHPSCSLFVYRILPPLGQYLVQRLLFLDGQVPFQTEVRSWHPPSQRSLQNKALWKLKQLQIIQGKANEIWLNPAFKANLLAALTGPSPIWAPINITLFEVEEDFQRTWNSVLYCVASGGGSHSMYKKTNADITALLLEANLLVKEKNKVTITNTGFQFLLADSTEQISTLLIQYAMKCPQNELPELLHLIFNAAFLVPGQAYDLTLLTKLQRAHLKIFSELGLVVIDKKEFIPTRLVKAIGYTSEAPLMVTKEEGYLVMETNYKFYAYTDSPLQLSILGLFIRIKTTFPNMIYCHLTQDSVQEAFKKGITAAQIIKFLASSAHPVMRSRAPVIPPTIIDQVNLWEQDRNRLKAKSGHMYQQFLSSVDFEKTLAEGNRIGAILYANPATRIMVISEAGHSQIKTFVKNNV